MVVTISKAVARRARNLIGDVCDLFVPQRASPGGDHAEHRVLFVCLGNICRSPTAAAVLRARLAERGLLERVEVESAGTHALPGLRPHRRARHTARRHGLRLDATSRRFSASDFRAYDSIVVFDRANRDAVLELARHDADRHKVRLLADEEIADPVRGGDADFARVYDAIETACARLADELESALGIGAPSAS